MTQAFNHMKYGIQPDRQSFISDMLIKKGKKSKYVSKLNKNIL